MNGGGPSTGVDSPMMKSPLYVTMPKPVSTPLVSNWKKTMIAYGTQKDFRVRSLVRAMNTSMPLTMITARIANWV